MRQLIISDLNAIASDVARYRADRVLSILDPGMPVPDLGLPPERHHVVACLDLDTSEGPNARDIAAIHQFGSECGERDVVIVHCHAGVSRSPAAALILRHLWREPLEIGDRETTPNLRMLALADHSMALMRHGRALARAAESKAVKNPF